MRTANFNSIDDIKTYVANNMYFDSDEDGVQFERAVDAISDAIEYGETYATDAETAERDELDLLDTQAIYEEALQPVAIDIDRDADDDDWLFVDKATKTVDLVYGQSVYRSGGKTLRIHACDKSALVQWVRDNAQDLADYADMTDDAETADRLAEDFRNAVACKFSPSEFFGGNLGDEDLRSLRNLGVDEWVQTVLLNLDTSVHLIKERALLEYAQAQMERE